MMVKRRGVIKKMVEGMGEDVRIIPSPPKPEGDRITDEQISWAKAVVGILDPDAHETLQAYRILVEARSQGVEIKEVSISPEGEREESFTDGSLQHIYDMLKTGDLKDRDIPEPPSEKTG